MPKPKHSSVPPGLLDTFRRMVAGVPGVDVKGDANPYVSLNGNMYASISKSGEIGVRLEKEARAAFLDDHQTTLFESIPGFFQKEYVTVPSRMHADTAFLRDLFRLSHAYATTLKPKATTRKKR